MLLKSWRRTRIDVHKWRGFHVYLVQIAQQYPERVLIAILQTKQHNQIRNFSQIWFVFWLFTWLNLHSFVSALKSVNPFYLWFLRPIQCIEHISIKIAYGLTEVYEISLSFEIIIFYTTFHHTALHMKLHI
jgi:hypothetical protein